MIKELKIGKLYIANTTLRWFSEPWHNKNVTNARITIEKDGILLLTSIEILQTQILTSWIHKQQNCYYEFPPSNLKYKYLDLL